MFKKIFFGFLFLLLIAFGALTYYISNMDWNRYKHDIADKFSDVTGKEIEFGGKVNISLLPKPLMSADNISVYNQGENKNPLATIKKMEMEVSLLSLLQGAPDVDSLSLFDAEVWVEQFENGGLNWKNSQDNAPGSNDDKKTSLRSLNLQNATFHFENKSANIKFDLDKINAEVHAVAYDGPYRLDGNFIKGGDHFAIAVGVGSLSSLDGVEINLSVAHPATESSFRFDGTYNPQEHNIKGDFSGGSKKTAQIINTLAQTDLMKLDNQQELQFSSGVEADENIIKLSSFVTKYGEIIEGSGSIDYPLNVDENGKRLIEIKYEFLNFDIRPLISVIEAKYAEFKNNGEEYLPDTDFNIKADLASKRIDFNDNDLGYLENVTLKANWIDNVLRLEEFFASAAGDTSISISGDLREEDIRPHYFLKNSIISTDFLSFANALGADLTSYVQSSYHNAEFNFSVLGDSDGFSVEGAELSMDKMKINADFSTSFEQEMPNFKLKAEADMLNLDNYMKNDSEKNDFLSRLADDLKYVDAVKNMNFDIDLTAGNAVFRSTPISSLSLKVKNEQGLLELEEISMQKVAGADINIAGTLNIQEETPKFENLKTEIKTANIADLISQTDFNLPSWKLFKTKTFELSSVINGTLDELQTQTLMNADGIAFNYDGKIKNPNKDTEFSGNLGIKTTNIGQLSEAFNLDLKNLPNKNGALNCSGLVDTKSDLFSYQQAKCVIGSANYSGDITISTQNELTNIQAKIEADEFNLAYLIELNPSKTANFGNENSFDNTFIARPDLSRDIISFDMYKKADYQLDITAQKAQLKRLSFDDIHFKLSNKDNALKFEEIDTLYKNAHYAGDITLSYANSDTPELKGNLRFNDFDIGLLGGSTYMFNNGIINGNTSFESKGNSIYELFSNLSGYVSMSVKNLNFKGFNFSAISKDIAVRKYSKGLFQAIRDNLQQGETEFEPFDVTIAMKNGKLTVTNLELKNQYANSDTSFEIDLKEWKISSKMIVSLTDIEDIPSFDISLNGMLQKPSLEINIENMVKRYDDNIKRIEEQEKAKQNALQAELNSQMESAQQKVQKLSEKLNSYAPVLEDYKAKSKKDENSLWYAKKSEQISAINKDLDIMKSLAHTPDFSAEDVASINNKIGTYENDIITLDEELNKRFADDLEIRFNKLLTTKSEIEIQLQKINSSFDSEYAKNLSELEKIGEDDVLLTDNDLQKKRNEVENLSKEITSLNAELDKILLPLNTSSDSKLKDETLLKAEAYAQIIENKITQLQGTNDNLVQRLRVIMENLQKQFQDGSAPKVDEMSVLQQNNEERAVEKTVENNISKGEKPLLKEFSNSTNASKNTADEINNKGIIIRSYDKRDNTAPEQPEKSGLLKEVDGAVRKASGTIIVK